MLHEWLLSRSSPRVGSSYGGALSWAQGNGTAFGVTKIRAILFTRNRKHWKDRVGTEIRVGDTHIRFNRKATRWLEVWQDCHLRFREFRANCIDETRSAEGRLGSIVNKHGISSVTGQTSSRGHSELNSALWERVGSERPVQDGQGIARKSQIAWLDGRWHTHEPSSHRRRTRTGGS